MLSNIAKYMIENPSSIREIMELVALYEKHPEKFPRPLIYLAGGWPQDPPPSILKEKFLEVIQENDLWKRGARYSPTIGFPDLLELIPVYEQKIFGRKNLENKNIVVGLGSTEQTAAIFRLLLDEGDEIILTKPGYLNYHRQICLETSLKAKIKYWSIINDGKFEPSIDDLNDLITPHTKILLITTPGNPDGQIWNDAILKQVHELAEDHNFYVILDVAYRAFVFGNIPDSFQRSTWEKEIWVCSFSKEFRAPGWRISYVIMPNELVRAFNTIEQARVLAPVSPVQMMLIKLFSDDYALKELKKAYIAGAKKYSEIASNTVKILREIESLEVLEPHGGFYVFFDVSSINPNDKIVWRELIDQKQLALAPGTDFNGARGWLRLSFAPVVETPEKLWEGIERLKEYIEEKRCSC
ncbi:MAG: pyridoxal phosphate-dependent aminotransferase [Candidatus Njordarchaeota archaeon]